jgi:glyoxylase-like metal-dependent hydrolase (beta-lactamase superfamily II)
VGNAFFVVGADEVLVIDGTIREETGKLLLEEIHKVSSKPITHVLLTHSDGDHINGLSAFPAGLTYIAHVNIERDIVKANADNKTRVPEPTVTFTDTMTVVSGTTMLHLTHYAAGHTDGDVVIHIPSQKLAFVGDMVFVGRNPLIHLHKNGSSFGLVKALQAVLALDADLYLSGHGDPVGRADVETVIGNLQKVQAKVKALVDAKKSIEDVRAEFDITPDPAQRWPHIAEVVYKELSGAQ